MNSPQLSRRQFVTAAALLGTTTLLGSRLSGQSPAPNTGPLTARQLVALLKTKMVPKWDESSRRDTFKCGNPDTVVKGVAATFMSTLDTIQRANQAGLNFVISHEPTFYSDGDTITPQVAEDPLYQHKKDYVEKNNMVVWRCHDHWHLFRPEPMQVGFARTLGWDKYTSVGGRTYQMPPTSVRDLARQISTKLQAGSVRIIGDPNLMVTKLGRGGHNFDQNASALATDVDAIVTSETRELDSIEYVRDLAASGQKKAMIVVAHETGEEAGMTEFTAWFSTVAPGIKVVNIKTTDKMWIA